MYDLGILYRGNIEDILEVVIRALNDIDWNVLHLDEMRDDAMSRALYERISDTWETDEIVSVPCPRTVLPSDGDVLDVVSSRTKRTIKKAMTDLDDENRIRYRTVELPEEAAEAAEMYALQHLQRWTDKGGSIFSDERITGFLTEVMRAAASDGKGMVFEVWIDGSLASQMLCLEDGDTMHAYRVGMSNRFSEFSPGNLVAHMAMQEAQRAGFTQFDFGTGSEEFKYRLGAKDLPVIRIQAKRGAVRTLSRLSSLPLIKQVAERSNIRKSALRAMHE